VLWQATVPGVDPLTVREGDPEPEHVDANGQAVAVVYETKQTHVFRLTLFSASDGSRRWDIELPGTSPMSAVTLTASRIFVSRWSGLFAYDVNNGQLLFQR
jgi:outer membrane protein assembly factor BamB